jgi:hypothetical protein
VHEVDSAVAAEGVPLADPTPPGLVSPHGITGDSLTLPPIFKRHDWLNVTFPMSEVERVTTLVTSYLGESKSRAGGINTYLAARGWEPGAILAWSDGRPECWLSMNGDSCDLIPPGDKLRFFQDLIKIGGKCTRIDAAIDVPRCLLGMGQVHAAATSGHVVGFRRYVPTRPVRDMATGELEGDMATFGRRGKDGSGRYVRVYDKGLESHGEIDAIRVEVELSGETAKQWLVILAESEDEHELERKLGRIVVGSILFADKSGAYGHADRFRVLPWWKRIAELVGSASVKVERVRPTLEKSVAWVKRSMPVTLARLAVAVDNLGMVGEELVFDLIRDLLRKGRRTIEEFDRSQPGDVAIDLDWVLHVATSQHVVTA